MSFRNMCCGPGGAEGASSIAIFFKIQDCPRVYDFCQIPFAKACKMSFVICSDGWNRFSGSPVQCPTKEKNVDFGDCSFATIGHKLSPFNKLFQIKVFKTTFLAWKHVKFTHFIKIPRTFLTCVFFARQDVKTHPKVYCLPTEISKQAQSLCW